MQADGAFARRHNFLKNTGEQFFLNKTKSPVYFMVIGAIPSFNITGFSRQPLLTTQIVTKFY
jgi:hypothetical protein